MHQLLIGCWYVLTVVFADECDFEGTELKNIKWSKKSCVHTREKTDVSLTGRSSYDVPI